jgi:purine-binding chemotaxis protein CheW
MNVAMKDPGEILRERARELARSVQPQAESSTMLELLEFRLAQERYAVETRFVQEVHPLKEITAVPCTPGHIRGIVNLRGRLRPVIDLKKLFELPEQGLTDLHRIILVRDREMEFGILADLTVGVWSLPAESLQPSLPTLTEIRAEYLMGVTADRLVVLDLEKIINDPKIIVSEQVGV